MSSYVCEREFVESLKLHHHGIANESFNVKLYSHFLACQHYINIEYLSLFVLSRLKEALLLENGQHFASKCIPPCLSTKFQNWIHTKYPVGYQFSITPVKLAVISWITATYTNPTHIIWQIFPSCMCVSEWPPIWDYSRQITNPKSMSQVSGHSEH